jgi:hypothetical protein
MNFREMVLEDIDWIYLPPDKDRDTMQALVNAAVMNLRFTLNLGNFSTS